ncbi:MAG: hypothetical protein U9Q16_01820 [Patescibacteria group bacterium]|nr:hypothetical protein [Patescibacteria group bacterium]
MTIKRSVLLSIFAVLSIVIIPCIVFASMALPRYGVNEETKECAKFFMGDECTSCELPEGWKMIEEFKCPNSYNKIQINSICTQNKSQFCCTVSHSGANGYCEDTVVNHVEKQCAFVEDINKCEKLPNNWQQAEIIDFWGMACPCDYEWIPDTLDCEINYEEEEIIKDNIDYKSFLFSIAILLIAISLFMFSKK